MPNFRDYISPLSLTASSPPLLHDLLFWKTVNTIGFKQDQIMLHMNWFVFKYTLTLKVLGQSKEEKYALYIGCCKVLLKMTNLVILEFRLVSGFKCNSQKICPWISETTAWLSMAGYMILEKNTHTRTHTYDSLNTIACRTNFNLGIKIHIVCRSCASCWDLLWC